MQRRMAQALLIVGLVLLTGCSSDGKTSHAPPLIFPTAVLGPPGPASLSVYLSSGVAGASAQYSISALDASDGQQRWNHIVKVRIQNEPLLDQGAIYFGSGDHHVYALNAGNGAQRWGSNIGGFPLVVAAADGILFASVNLGSSVQTGAGPIYALNESNGSVRWHSPISGLVDLVQDGILYVGSTDQNLYAIKASDGSLLWHFQTAYVPAQVQVLQGQVYLLTTAPNRQTPESILYVLNASDGTLQWRYPTQDNQESVSLIAIDQGTVYVTASQNQNAFFQSLLLALKASDGSEHWHYQRTSQTASFTSTLLDNGVIYLGQNTGEIYALNGSDGSLRWQVKLGNALSGIQLVDQGVIYTSDFGTGIAALASIDGSVLWKYQTGGFAQVVAVVTGLAIGYDLGGNSSSSGHNYAFALNPTDGTTFWRYDAGGTPFFPIVG